MANGNEMHSEEIDLADVVSIKIQDALFIRFGTVQQVETVKLRPWSQVYRVVAERGISYFKICGPDAQHEVSLFEWLLPDHLAILPEIIALEPEQGWIFMADAGIPFRDLPQPENHRQRLQSLLSSYARLQQRSLNYIDNLLEMSLPDRRLERIPHLLQDLVKTGSNNGWIDAVLRNQVLETMTTASIDSLKAEARLALCLGLVLRAMDMAYMLQSADEESVNRWSPFVSKYLAQWVQLEATIPRNNLD